MTSARRKLEASRINPRELQRELMGEDIDTDKFSTYLAGVMQVDLAGLITAADVSRTIEGASTLTVNIDDYERAILRSPALHHKLDIEVDGLWFRLAKVEKQDEGDGLNLTFEDREVAILRTYKKKKVASRRHVTRAEFVLNMIREVKELRIPVVIPELNVVQAVSTAVDVGTALALAEAKALGITPSEANMGLGDPNNIFSPTFTGPWLTQPNIGNTRVLTVKGKAIDKDQIANANTILRTGGDLGVRRKVLVCSIMTAIQESTLRNLTGGDLDSVGLFQQRDSWGTFEERHDPATAARLFFLRAHQADIDDSTRPYWDLCQEVQRSAFPTAYADWRTEAEKIVTAYGSPGGDNFGDAAEANGSHPSGAVGSDYIYYRGTPKGTGKTWKKENSWDCINRLAAEVSWRAFFVSGTFYFLSENVLYGQRPIAVLREFDLGVEGIGGDLDTNKKGASVSVRANIGRWLAPPGSVVQLADMGPFDGRWLVYDIDRSMFSSEASITLHKPRPQLPEPAQNDITVQAQKWNWSVVPAPETFPPLTGTDVPTPDVTGLRLQRAVLNNPLITFSNDLEREDITSGEIYEPLLRFLLWMANNGFTSHISALKSDHSTLTTEGHISAHSAGKAVDIDTYNSSNRQTDLVMRTIAAHQIELGFSQLIGPNPLLVIPLGIYDAQTLGEHKSHIHVGWPL